MEQTEKRTYNTITTRARRELGLHTATETAQIVGIPYRRLMQMADNGDVPAIPVSVKYLFNPEAVAEAIIKLSKEQRDGGAYFEE